MALMLIDDECKNRTFSSLTLDNLLNCSNRYIENLSPSYIFALSETATDHQVPALRDAIWKHVALQPSIGVKIPVSEFVSKLHPVVEIRPADRV